MSRSSQVSPTGRRVMGPALAIATLLAGCETGLGPPGARTDDIRPLPEGALDPRVDGNRLVYETTDSRSASLVALDLASGEIETIDLEPDWIGPHDVSSERIAWFRRGGLVVAERHAGVLVHGDWSGRTLDIDGERAVFAGSAGSLDGLLLGDLTTGEAIRISGRGGSPRLSGDHVAWIEVFGGGVAGRLLGPRSVIKLYDRISGDTTAIRNVYNHLQEPRIGPGFVAWSEANGEHDGGFSWDVRGYDIETETGFDVATGPTFQLAVAVLDGYVAWMEDREPGDGRLAVHLLETATGAVRRVSDWGVSFVAADRGQILWRDGARLVRFRLD